jgi:hypothetical protein
MPGTAASKTRNYHMANVWNGIELSKEKGRTEREGGDPGRGRFGRDKKTVGIAGSGPSNFLSLGGKAVLVSNLWEVELRLDT